MKPIKIDLLIRNFFENKLSKDIQLQFQRWITGNSFQKEKESTMKELWDESESLADESTIADFHKVMQRIENKEIQVVVPKYALWKRMARIAAIIALPLISSIATLWFTNNKTVNTEPEMVQCYVPNGELKEVKLEDGTSIWINSGSLLIYPKHFTGDKRTLYLSGEAYFTVAKNPDKPFIVKTKDISVRALGTMFNVQSYPEMRQVTTTLEEGKVKVGSFIGGAADEYLLPNEQVVFDVVTSKFNKSIVDASTISNWRQGVLTFQSENMSNIISALERHYNITINYEDGKFKDRRFTVKFQKSENCNQSFEVLNLMIPDFKYTLKGNVAYIH
jgi:ferric-dicitrate binding protein FerR (iron transport regulator)